MQHNYASVAQPVVLSESPRPSLKRSLSLLDRVWSYGRAAPWQPSRDTILWELERARYYGYHFQVTRLDSTVLGWLVVLNWTWITTLDIGDRLTTVQGWESILPELSLPRLRTLVVRTRFPTGAVVAEFLTRHDFVEHLDLSGVGRHLLTSGFDAVRTFKNLRYVSADPWVLAHVLRATHERGLLTHVCVTGAEWVQARDILAVWDLLAGHSTVKTLTMHLSCVQCLLPLASAPSETTVFFVDNLNVHSPRSEDFKSSGLETVAFRQLLGRFPALEHLWISWGDAGANPHKAIVDNVHAFYPEVTIETGRRLRPTTALDENYRP
ncbi:P-type phospholipid transporter [Mycena chlorophos]|uniref:P-type phospholipid transporter n=1 Tax=Mycena chlorophos TaxID=658473 RepID=A0A8H6TAP0_MYCCL|nr:P-type phospholipid transporter [Mycena chlorophos]